MLVMLLAAKALARAVMSGDRPWKEVKAEAELSEEALLSEDRASASAEVCAHVKTLTMTLFASSELSKVQRMSKMAFKR